MAGKNGSSKSGAKKNGGEQKKAGSPEVKPSAGSEERQGAEANGGKLPAPSDQAKAPEPRPEKPKARDSRSGTPKGRESRSAEPKTPGAKPRHPRKKGLTGLEAAAQVLTESGKPMRCGELAAAIAEKGLWKTNGKTPAATLNAGILREIRVKGSASRFKKTGSGLFAGTGVAL